MQLGVGANTSTINHEFKIQKGGNLDFLGIDDGYRKLPTSMPAKNAFSLLDEAQKTNIGKDFAKNLGFNTIGYPENLSLQFSKPSYFHPILACEDTMLEKLGNIVTLPP